MDIADDVVALGCDSLFETPIRQRWSLLIRRMLLSAILIGEKVLGDKRFPIVDVFDL